MSIIHKFMEAILNILGNSCHVSSRSFLQFRSSNQSMDAILNIPGQQYSIYGGKELLDHHNFDFNYHIAHSQLRIEHAIGILKGRLSSLHEFCVILHNLLADLEYQWNELYEEDELDSAPVVKDNIENSKNGIRDILHPITLSHFEEPQ
ncbi:hypothetical protein VP01_7053g1 [Puccinia sorghi]|uniref:DDE Tnp4 domain-containing protein n=1 Tax=Puccinia sorghi TaxID=27349 RepID=A0A0L6UFU9_9BASI|nr:hypothetical protein VP01_7053g1 [Puccinia sorghi]